MDSERATSGGDWQECYEYVLMNAQTTFSWRFGSQRALVMIGDAMPHSPEEAKAQNKIALKWEEEVEKLVRMVSETLS